MTGERVRVGDILRLIRRPVAVDPLRDYEEIGVRSFGKGIFHKEPVSGTALGAKRVFEIHPRELVLSNVFAWEGAVAVSSEADSGKIGSHRFMTYEAIDERIDIDWASWFFKSEQGVELLGKASPGSAGRNRTLAVERFEALEIPLPPIDQQRRAASRLDQAARFAALLTSRAEHASRCVVAYRASLVSGSQGAKDWRSIPLREVLSLECDAVKVDAATDYPVAGVYSFGRGLFRRSSLLGANTTYKSLNRLRAGRLVMSRLKAWEGALALVTDDYDGTFLSPEFPTFELNDEVLDQRYAEAFFTSELFWSRLQASSQGIGARKERVTAERLVDVVVSLPPLHTQVVIAEQLQRLADAMRHGAGRQRLISCLVPSTMNQEFKVTA